jgi:hypothetical protein
VDRDERRAVTAVVGDVEGETPGADEVGLRKDVVSD